jgi:hypothetical protein
MLTRLSLGDQNPTEPNPRLLRIYKARPFEENSP